VIAERLTQLVRQRIQTQALSGDGQGEHILGVLNRAGVATVEHEAGAAAADAILRVLTTVRLANASPTGVLVNPLTYQSILTQRAGDGSRLDSPGALAGAPVDSAWGIPLIQTAAVGPDKPILADWARAATLYIREGLTARVSDSDQDDFVRNVVTVLVETRVGLMVSYPQAICVVELDGASGASGASSPVAAQAKTRAPQTRPRGAETG